MKIILNILFLISALIFIASLVGLAWYPHGAYHSHFSTLSWSSALVGLFFLWASSDDDDDEPNDTRDAHGGMKK